MGQDEYLKGILECARRICLVGVGEESGMISPDTVKEMAKNVLRLDKVLSGGGHLPKRWAVPASTSAPAASVKADGCNRLSFEGVDYKLPLKDNLTAQEVVDCLREQGLRCSVSGDESVQIHYPQQPETKSSVTMGKGKK